MAVTFTATGADFVSNASTSFNSTGPGQDGDFGLRSGTKPFPDDYVIEFFATGEDGNGELGQGSGITGIKVYASAADFDAGIVLFDYQPRNPGETGSVRGDGSGTGDCYISFNSVFPTPPGAPQLSGQLFVAPGSDAANQIGSFTSRRFEDVDFNGDGDFDDPNETGNGKFAPEKSVICFTRGSMIITQRGLRPIEGLREGDRVFTRDNGLQPVTWIGKTKLSRATLARQANLQPIRIAKGALGDTQPERDLIVSPNHRILLTGGSAALHFGEGEILVPAKHLLGQPGVTRVAASSVIYTHLLFTSHEIILADGLWSESFQPVVPGLRGLDNGTRKELHALFPELCGPGVTSPFPSARRSLKRHEAEVMFS